MLEESRSNQHPEAQTVDDEVKKKTMVLLASIFVIATNGVIYELLIAGYSSYLLGDSITQFSLTIGVFMSSMGVGSWITQRFEKNLIQRFIEVELLLALVGGPTVLALAMTHIYTRVYAWVMFLFIIILGIFIGFEIPIVTRIVNRYGSLKAALANVLSFDYIGALLGSVAFPLFFLPTLGFAKTSFFIGFLNLIIAVINLFVFREEMGQQRSKFFIFSAAIAAFLLLGFLFSAQWIEDAREKSSGQKVVYQQHSRYQTIRFVKEKNHLAQTVYRLYLNHEHQFSSHHEHRYHESLVHPAMTVAKETKRVLVLGAGDGFVLRELWKYQQLKKVVLVDLDPAMTLFGKTHPWMVKKNQSAFKDKRLKVVHTDAMEYLKQTQLRFDVVILDLPVPTNISLSKLYTRTFYRLLKRVVKEGGVAVTEAANVDSVENKPFWCLINTQKAAGWFVQPYLDHTMGFTMMTTKKADIRKLRLKVKTKHLSNSYVQSLFSLPNDIFPKTEVAINTIDKHQILGYIQELR